MQTLVTIQKKGSNFEQRERNFSNMCCSGSRMRGQKSLQNQIYRIFFVFITTCFHSAVTFIRF